MLTACGAAVIHAGFSIYWAFGGRWLLNTVGAWAVHLANRSPLHAGIALAAIGLVKLAGGLVPIAVEHGAIAGRRWWRFTEWVGATVLVLYGAVNVIVGWAVLTGVITTPGGYDRAAEIGHAALWDPLFLAWGACLATGLALTRHTPPPTHPSQ